MDRGFAVGHFSFPALPRRGERHTAADGSVWEFALTGTDWWELAEHAPTSPTVELLSAALKREGDWESKLQHSERAYWLPIAERLLADTELLDAIVAHHQRPVAFVVVHEEHGVMNDAVFFDSLTRANTAEGIASGYAEPGEEFTVYALTDPIEESTE